MSVLDDLAPDQRAVLQMVLQRGRSYDEIASVLSIDRQAVRQRALDAFDALTPATVLPGPERALVTDYLLGQLPEKVSEQVYAYLEASDADREWAGAMAGVVAPLASGALPEIPVGAPLGADDLSAGGLEQDSDPSLAERVAEPAAAAAPRADPVPALPGTANWEADRERVGPSAPRADRPRPSSRRGGAILLGVVGLLIVAAIVVAVVGTGGGSPAKHGSHRIASRTGTGKSSTGAGATQPGAGGTTTGAGGSTTGAGTTGQTQILAQVNLTSPTGASQTVGIAQVIRVRGVVGVAIDAQGVPPNTTHNAYAVWLYNSPTSYLRAGFVQNLVGKDGKLSALGRLPAGAGRYHRLLITLETRSQPTHPGEVVLSGPFREHP